VLLPASKRRRVVDAERVERAERVGRGDHGAVLFPPIFDGRDERLRTAAELVCIRGRARSDGEAQRSAHAAEAHEAVT